MKRALYKAAGLASLGLAALGVALPLLPTVPFVILAAFFFSKGSPELERRLLEHRSFGPHIRNWREHRAISRKGKRAAVAAFAASVLISLIFAPWPWKMAPVVAMLVFVPWLWTRPEV